MNKNNNADMSLTKINEEEIEMKANKNVTTSLNTNPKEETKMKKNNNVNLSLNTNKEEETMNEFHAEVKDFETGYIERALITDQGETYLVKAYMLESDGRIMVPHRHFPSYTLSKSMEGFEYALYLQGGGGRRNK